MSTQAKLRALYEPYMNALDNAPLKLSLAQTIDTLNNGNATAALDILEGLPSISVKSQTLNQDVVSVTGDIDANTSQQINATLRQFSPWRKGPFTICDVEIDSEWRCNLKWDRIANEMAPLENRRVLDVGCGNGYYGWRLRGAGARHVVGIDPSWVSISQFFGINHFIKDYNHIVLPLRMEDMPPKLAAFDTVLSMGVLYHRRDPLAHITELFDALRPGGELVIETLVIEGGEGQHLMPPARYARMNNVWFLPSAPSLEAWLAKIGFENIRTVDVTHTTIDEQRATSWKKGDSLIDFLDPTDSSKTVEGHPAPLRAILIANRPQDAKRLKRYDY
jgi:tRNA (mo5U34)-methyltransferase